MSRPLLIFVIFIVAVLILLFGLASLDRPVTTTHVEQPVTNAAGL